MFLQPIVAACTVAHLGHPTFFKISRAVEIRSRYPIPIYISTFYFCLVILKYIYLKKILMSRLPTLPKVLFWSGQI